MDKRTINGILIAITIQLITLVVVCFFFLQKLEVKVGLLEFLKYSIQSKSILRLGALASVPNVLLFFLQINQHKIRFAKGVQYVVIAFVLFLLLVKFI